jgi:hypothetical protein
MKVCFYATPNKVSLNAKFSHLVDYYYLSSNPDQKHYLKDSQKNIGRHIMKVQKACREKRMYKAGVVEVELDEEEIEVYFYQGNLSTPMFKCAKIINEDIRNKLVNLEVSRKIGIDKRRDTLLAKKNEKQNSNNSNSNIKKSFSELVDEKYKTLKKEYEEKKKANNSKTSNNSANVNDNDDDNRME